MALFIMFVAINVIMGVSSFTASTVFDGVLPQNYSKYESPTGKIDTATKVTCNIIPLSITSVAAVTMHMSVELQLFLSWEEPRLNSTIIKHFGKKYFRFPQKIANVMWFPVITFDNCQGCPDPLMDPEKDGVLYYTELKQAYIWIRRTFTFICHFDLSVYPFDTQTCSIKIKADDSKPIHVTHTMPNVVQSVNVPPEFRLKKITNSNCSYDKEFYSSCFSYDFTLNRGRIRPILLIFLPSVLIVCLSWISFWLDVGSPAPRVALGLTSMLTLATQFSSAQRALPAISTIMALDIWMFVCIFMVFASLMEFAVVSYKCKSYIRVANESSINQFQDVNCTLSEMCKKLGYIATFPFCPPQNIDKLSRILFPLIFFIFNIFFWFYYYS